jgi:hypothetical protein
MKAVFLTERGQVAAYFAMLAPFFERVPVQGEFTYKDLEQLANEGKMHLGYFENDGEIRIAIAFEFVRYPRLVAVNIAAVAGELLDEVMVEFWDLFKAWCKNAGADSIDAQCNDAMMRLLARYGMRKTYNHVRTLL